MQDRQSSILANRAARERKVSYVGGNGAGREGWKCSWVAFFSTGGGGLQGRWTAVLLSGIPHSIKAFPLINHLPFKWLINYVKINKYQGQSIFSVIHPWETHYGLFYLPGRGWECLFKMLLIPTYMHNNCDLRNFMTFPQVSKEGQSLQWGVDGSWL